MSAAGHPQIAAGQMMKRWRVQRRRSQLDVSLATDVSARHLSCIETGRSRPSPGMIARLCDELDVPLRARNQIYLAAGFAPAHHERTFADLGAARQAVQSVLDALQPNPSVAVNAVWELVAVNDPMVAFLDDLPEELVTTPVNVLRATLHPRGLASRITNLPEWRRHVLRRVRRQLERTGSKELGDLLAELEDYHAPEPEEYAVDEAFATPQDVATPLRLATPHGELSLLYTVTVFGSPRDVLVDEIAVETFFPADEASGALLRMMVRD